MFIHVGNVHVLMNGLCNVDMYVKFKARLCPKFTSTCTCTVSIAQPIIHTFVLVLCFIEYNVHVWFACI